MNKPTTKDVLNINLSPTFLSKVYSKGYNYAVGEKLGMFESPDNKGMDDGRLMHKIIASHITGTELEDIAISPYDNYRTKEAQEWRDSQPDNVSIVSQESLDSLQAIVDRLLVHPQMLSFPTDEIVAEVTRENKIKEHNVKGIIDFIARDEEQKIVVDWKFVSTTVFDGFEHKSRIMNYDLQAAMYDYLEQPTHVYFGVIENGAPYRIKFYWCDQSFLDSGAEKFNKAFKEFDGEHGRVPDFNIRDVGTLMGWQNYNG